MHYMIQSRTHDFIHNSIDKIQFMVRLICLLRALIECNAFYASIWIEFDSVLGVFFGKKILDSKNSWSIKCVQAQQNCYWFLLFTENSNSVENSFIFGSIWTQLSITATTFVKIQLQIRQKNDNQN